MERSRDMPPSPSPIPVGLARRRSGLGRHVCFCRHARCREPERSGSAQSGRARCQDFVAATPVTRAAEYPPSLVILPLIDWLRLVNYPMADRASLSRLRRDRLTRRQSPFLVMLRPAIIQSAAVAEPALEYQPRSAILNWHPPQKPPTQSVIHYPNSSLAVYLPWRWEV